MSEKESELKFKFHENYFKLNLSLLPTHYQSTDSSRLTLVYFCLSAMDLLSIKQETNADWILNQLIESDVEYGFRGGPFMGHLWGSKEPINEYDQPDGLDKINPKKLTAYMSKFQKEDGSFSPTIDSTESDMRFLFCACAISYILNDWSGINIEKALNFIKQSQNYDGAFGCAPDNESHGGSTYCAVAALALMGKLDTVKQDKLINKPDDTCYAYWIGGSLKMLGAYQFVDVERLEKFLNSTLGLRGGYGKNDPKYPDVMHSYMGLVGLAIAGKYDLKPFHVALGVSIDAVEKAKLNGFCSAYQKIN
ncbi:Geranylgeranyl transferase type-1 subunit beta [Boothiomyces macroporosus]|uniref:Geranylgeranyl transferase type-1 subunit beta n=1 Tax=Boothiomyces macroporosus TaxID=261099 RepID=A0AAD5UHU5_9FUNG|nr:Geranylgeranyl transferase type-1 subunit beta [Boothiomyces macroporosus]